MIIAMCGFVSCGSDDDDDNDGSVTGAFKSNFYIGDEKQDISELVSNIFYDEDDETISVLLISENENKKLGQFHARFEGVDFNLLKVNDDLVQKSNMTNYMLGINGISGMYNMVDDFYDDNGEAYIGKAIVKSIDISKKHIEIDFQDATIINASSKAKQKIRGSISSFVEFRD